MTRIATLLAALTLAACGAGGPPEPPTPKSPQPGITLSGITLSGQASVGIARNGTR